MRGDQRIRRRRVRFDHPSEVAAEAERLLRGRYERAGTWSLGQVCEHLAQTVEESVKGENGFAGFLLPVWKRVGARSVLYLMLMTRWIPAGVKLPNRALPR